MTFRLYTIINMQNAVLYVIAERFRIPKIGHKQAAMKVLSREFSLSEDDIIKEGLRIFLERKLREIKSEIFRIAGKYKIKTIEEFDQLYKTGQVEEKDSWNDYQKLDHLEFKKEEIERLLQAAK